jgi:uncharacterized GH25 family protein
MAASCPCSALKSVSGTVFETTVVAAGKAVAEAEVEVEAEAVTAKLASKSNTSWMRSPLAPALSATDQALAGEADSDSDWLVTWIW